MSKRIGYVDSSDGLVIILERLTEKRPKGIEERGGSIVLGTIPKQLSVDIAHAKILIDDINESTKSCCPICGCQLSPLSKYVAAMKYRNWYICTRCGCDLFWDPEKLKWFALLPLDKWDIVKKEKVNEENGEGTDS